MSSVFLFVENKRERQVLKIICESFGFDVIMAPLEFSSLPQLTQYKPTAAIIEILPNKSESSYSFIKQIRNEAKTAKLPLLLYSDNCENSFTTKFNELNYITFVGRPLTTASIKAVLLKDNNREATLHRDVKEVYEGAIDELSKIMSKSISPGTRINLMVERVGELLAFPFTIAKVLSVTQSSTTGASDLAKAIEIDPVVVAAILKVANSALYGRAGKSISSIKDAIVRIGFTETKNIAISLSIMMLFSDEENSIGFDRKEFWYHSLAVAVIASKFAKKMGFSKPELAFVAGLLHDFGIIILDEFFPSFLFTTLRSATQKGVSFLEEEEELWGMTHNDVVFKLFEKWNMPREVLIPLKEWKWPFNFHDSISNELTQLVHLVYSSEIIAKSLELGRECDEHVVPLPQTFFDEAKITSPLDKNFFKAIDSDMSMFSKYLGLNHEPFTFSRDIPQDDRVAYINYIDYSNSMCNPFELYLITQNFQLQYKKSREEIDAAQTKPELLFFYCDEDTTSEDISSYINLPLEVEEEDDYYNKEWFTPIVVIGPHFKREEFENLPQYVTFFESNMDLRVLLFSIKRLLMGKPIITIEEEVEEISHQAVKTDYSNLSLSVKTRIINNKSVVLTLNGGIRSDNIKELKQLISTLLTRTRRIVINFGELFYCEDAVVVLLDEFRKVLFSKKVVFVLYAYKAIPSEWQNETNSEIILIFNSDEEIDKHINYLEKQFHN